MMELIKEEVVHNCATCGEPGATHIVVVSQRRNKSVSLAGKSNRQPLLSRRQVYFCDVECARDYEMELSCL